jgi:hypothetical protein
LHGSAPSGASSRLFFELLQHHFSPVYLVVVLAFEA